MHLMVKHSSSSNCCGGSAGDYFTEKPAALETPPTDGTCDRIRHDVDYFSPSLIECKLA
jgi:hypothetical protein